MARPLVSDELWELIEPLIPKGQRRFRYPGRRRLDDRKVVDGDLVRVADGDSVGVPAAGDGQWLGDDLLAQAARVAAGWCLAAAA
jgi:transposase